MEDISGHLPCITLVNKGSQIYKELIEIEFLKTNDENINILCTRLNAMHWETLLHNDKNADKMYCIFIDDLQGNINNIMPKK